MPRVQVFKAIKDGKCMQIADSHETMERGLLKNWAYDPAERDQWSFEMKTADVPLVTADYFVIPGGDDDDRDYPHAAWICPDCGYKETTDIDPEDSPPALWFSHCKETTDYVLVTWQQDARQPT